MSRYYKRNTARADLDSNDLTAAARGVASLSEARHKRSALRNQTI